MSERILIAGAGPAGAATALAMLRAGLEPGEIAVLDAMAGVGDTMRGPDSRILALNAGSCRLLQSLGVWPALGPEAHPMRSIALSDTALEADIRPLSLGFEASEGEPLAHLVPLGLLQKVLRAALADAGVTIRPEIIRAFREDGDSLLIETNRGRQNVSLLIGADGRVRPCGASRAFPCMAGPMGRWQSPALSSIPAASWGGSAAFSARRSVCAAAAR